ncbi:MAG: hypothetical protein LBJ20_03880, partial [Candidatus Methanoplasma sp.]|nr:hypothetical protein [Candidatus Methanoplasma sp.]
MFGKYPILHLSGRTGGWLGMDGKAANRRKDIMFYGFFSLEEPVQRTEHQHMINRLWKYPSGQRSGEGKENMRREETAADAAVLMFVFGKGFGFAAVFLFTVSLSCARGLCVLLRLPL